MINQNQKKIAPVNLFGARKIFTYKPCEEPVKSNGTTFVWQTLVEIDIESMHHATYKKPGDSEAKPGIWINKDRNDVTSLFLSFDEDPVHLDRQSCLEVIDEINKNTLIQVERAKEKANTKLEEAMREVEEMDEIHKMVSDIIKHMK